MQAGLIRGFLFDLHGVIADSWQYHLASWQAIAVELKIPWTTKLTQMLPGMSRRDSLITILASVNRQAEFDEDQLLAVTDHENELYRQFVAQMTPANRLPGITAFLDELQVANYPLALASASTNAPAEIERLGLRPVFTKIVAAADLSASKPAPDVYLAAAKLIDQSPQRCVALEDTVTGVQAAKAAGCLTIGINVKQLPGADGMLSTTADLSLAAVQRVLGLPTV
ncbi:HAD-IA family hydrolase [Levilactobacillus fujinensis]|uniref:HAD-IA family hydrolase n=1 Tax=Levilactobacillus fujinensis TaxID=2486024 RepID=A0ABW1TD29_9LACO|nr:HAD-IA family hydrolase [Levilactobacillus fujinensis]